MRKKATSGVEDNPLAVEWMHANYGFHDVIYAAAETPYLERLAKSARRTFVGQITWVARAELDELYERNDREHRAIREAIAAGSAGGREGARPRARAALVGAAGRDPRPRPRPRARPAHCLS